jgi:hypothetical protein
LETIEFHAADHPPRINKPFSAVINITALTAVADPRLRPPRHSAATTIPAHLPVKITA